MDTYNVRCLLDKLCAHNVAGHNWNAHCTTADDKWKAPQFWVCVCVHQWNAWYSFSIIHIHIYIFFSSIIHAITWPDMPWFACSARRLSAHATIYFVFVVVKIRAVRSDTRYPSACNATAGVARWPTKMDAEDEEDNNKNSRGWNNEAHPLVVHSTYVRYALNVCKPSVNVPIFINKEALRIYKYNK